jgi:hypothetical protein
MLNNCPKNAAEAAKHVSGATIAWGGGNYFDFENPEATTMTIEDYAYALAYTVRWRGQARSGGRRVFYGVGEHCVRGAEAMLVDGHSPVDALAFLMHESGEVPFGDTPGPVKPLMGDGFRAVIKRCGAAIDARFGVICPDPALIKRWDIRMLVTEKRDLLAGHEGEVWDNGGSNQTSTDGYAPLPGRIVPFDHPDEAAERFLLIERMLRRQIG